MFKVVFLGNSGVGKSSFIHHYCTGSSLSKSSATVGKANLIWWHFLPYWAFMIKPGVSVLSGIDFQMKTLSLGSTTITLKLWDTAGQERWLHQCSCHILSPINPYPDSYSILLIYNLWYNLFFISFAGFAASLSSITERLTGSWPCMT